VSAGKVDHFDAIRTDRMAAINCLDYLDRDYSNSVNAELAFTALVAASRALVDGLDSTHWSSWQSTDKFTGHMDTTRAALAAFPEPPK
jgi:hypothetical protein